MIGPLVLRHVTDKSSIDLRKKIAKQRKKSQDGATSREIEKKEKKKKLLACKGGRDQAA